MTYRLTMLLIVLGAVWGIPRYSPPPGPPPTVCLIEPWLCTSGGDHR